MQRLISNVRRGNNANTYIFEGTPGLNRHNAARLFAKALVCDAPNQAPCCECSACREAQAGSHPDIVFVKPEKDRATLGIKPIRAMVTESLVTPFYDRHKVFIIDDGDILTIEAQNAFLKAIEEPPDYAVYIIVCTDSGSLLQTVRSRSVIISFPPISDDMVRRYIEAHYPNERDIDFFVKYCAGVPKTADKIINNEDFERLREETLNIVPRILSRNKLHAYAAAEFFEKNKNDASVICDMILLYLRDALVMSMGRADKVINSDKSEKISLLAGTYTPAVIAAAEDEIIFTKKLLDRYVKASAAILHAALKTHMSPTSGAAIYN